MECPAQWDVPISDWPKGIDLKCPQGTTFSKFPEESQITVTCTGEYLFNVKGLATGKEWKKEENINFGCSKSIKYQKITE